MLETWTVCLNRPRTDSKLWPERLRVSDSAWTTREFRKRTCGQPVGNSVLRVSIGKRTLIELATV